MGKPHRRFCKEFETEALRLVEMSGRTQREIAEDQRRDLLQIFEDRYERRSTIVTS